MSNIIVPQFTLNIGGMNFDANMAANIQEIVIEEQASGSSTLEVEVADPDFYLLDSGIFETDSPVYYSLTIMGAFYSAVFDGFISASDNTFPEDGIPTVRIMCMDKTHTMNREEHSKTWRKTRASDIATELAGNAGLSASVDPSPGDVEESISQARQTDIQFLMELAADEKEPYAVFVRENTLYYKKINSTEGGQMTLSYRINGKDIRSFAPRTNIEDIKERTTDANINNQGDHIDGEAAPAGGGGGGSLQPRTALPGTASQGSRNPGAPMIQWTNDPSQEYGWLVQSVREMMNPSGSNDWRGGVG